jgi:beta-N-acetylhexosaminidase
LDAGAPGGRHAVAGRGLARLGAAAARGALRVDGRLPASLAGAHVVELDRPANLAAGAVPWGLGVALRHVDPRATTTRVAEGDDAAVGAALAAATGRPVVVVVRDPQRRPAQAATLARLLAARPDAVVVDMGWPVDPAARPPAAAWITTHGASRASGDAVARLLGRAASAPDDSPATATPGRTARG